MQDEIVFRLKTESGTPTPTAAGDKDGLSALSESIKSLNTNLKDFTVKLGTIKNNASKPVDPSYAQTTSRMRAEAYKTRSEFLNDPEGKQIQQQRAQANLLRIQTEQQRQELKQDILKRASDYKLSGDTKFAKKLESDV